jgi:hypothetical protein
MLKVLNRKLKPQRHDLTSTILDEQHLFKATNYSDSKESQSALLLPDVFLSGIVVNLTWASGATKK